MQNNINFKKHIQAKADRHALWATLNTGENILLSLFKISLAVFYASIWLLVFGIYYAVMFVTRCVFLHLYTKQRINHKNLFALREYLIIGGLFYITLGGTFLLICMYMYRYESNAYYNKYIMLIVATLGFIKIISSIVGLINSRKLHNPLIIYLKSLNVIDSLFAIVLTQYAILSFQHSANASSSTGLFGMSIGIIIILTGIFITAKNLKN